MKPLPKQVSSLHFTLDTALYIIGLLENLFNIHVLTLALIPKGLTPFDE